MCNCETVEIIDGAASNWSENDVCDSESDTENSDDVCFGDSDTDESVLYQRLQTINGIAFISIWTFPDDQMSVTICFFTACFLYNRQ